MPRPGHDCACPEPSAAPPTAVPPPDPIIVSAALATAAFAAGVLNALAGGGSFLTFPALVWAGVPPIAANATSALAVSPGYLGSTLGLAAQLRALPRERLWREAVIAAAGGLVGAGLLLLTPARLFTALVPWLLLFATALFAAGPAIIARRAVAARTPSSDVETEVVGNCTTGTAPSRARDLGLAAVAVYGGYFNGGLGILLMALYTLAGEPSLSTVNALKNGVSLVLSWLSVAAFIAAGAIAWRHGLLMMAAATLGGYVGARWSTRLPAKVLRALVITTGAAMSLAFFIRG